RSPLERRQAYPVRIAKELSDDEAAPGLDPPCQLAQRGVLIGHLAKRRHEKRSVEPVLFIRKHARVTLGGDDVAKPSLARRSHRVIEHLALHIENLKHAVRTEPLRHRQRVVAGPWTHLQEALATGRRERVAQARPRDQRMRRLDPKALAVWTGARMRAPPQRNR